MTKYCKIIILISIVLSCKKPNEDIILRIKEETVKIARDSSDYNAFIIRGGAYAQLGKLKEALNDYNRAIVLMPQGDYSDAYVYTSRGDIYFKFGNKIRAMEDFNTAIRLKPSEPYPYLRRGIAKHSLGNKEEGCLDIQKSSELGLHDKEVINKYCK